MDNRVVESLNKVKWLGDVPILGTLFRTKSIRKSSDELLVVVTPRFVRPLSPEEKAKLPDQVEAFLPTTEEEKAAGVWGKKLKSDPLSQPQQEKKPEFVGPRGHQEPK